MPSCRHVAPPRATFLQVGEGGGHPDALVISLSSRGSFLRDHGASVGVDNTVQYFYSFREENANKKLVESHEQSRPWARLPPSENECFVRSVHRDVFSCYIRLVISIRGLNRRGMSPNQPTSLFAFQLRKCFATITFIKIQTRRHLEKLISTKKTTFYFFFFSNE